MKRFGTKQLIPIATAIVGIVFAYIGVTQLGFWDREPQPGFFPTIISVVLIAVSVLAFIQTLHEEGQPDYNKGELSVILGGAAVILLTFVIGLIPTAFVFVLFWLKVVEKDVPWRDIIIIEIVVGIIVIGVFYMWLQIRFPWGLFELIM